MLISPAYAQAGAAAEPNMLVTFLPLIAIFAIFYFLMIRPQQKKMKQHKEMIGNLRRGDKVVTAGGFLGTVAKVNDDELDVEIARDVKVRVVRSTIAEVVSKTQPRADKASAKKDEPAAKKEEPANDEELADQADSAEGEGKKSVFRRRR